MAISHQIPHQTARVRSGDVSISFRRVGPSAENRVGDRGQTPILIVHGLSYFSYDWLGVAQALGRDREVICMDMRGFGDSDWSAQQDYSVPAMAQDILNVLDHALWSRAVLIGHSMGGRSTTCAAAKYPARVAGLALIDYSPENAPGGSKRVAQIVASVPEKFRSVDEAMSFFGQNNRARFEEYLKPVEGGFILKRDTYFRDQFKRLIETGERPKLGVDMWQLLGEVRCPVLSMRGSRSDMYALETRDKMKAANPRIQIAEVDAGHNIAGENPEGFLGALNPFLASLEHKTHEHQRN